MGAGSVAPDRAREGASECRRRACGGLRAARARARGVQGEALVRAAGLGLCMAGVGNPVFDGRQHERLVWAREPGAERDELAG